MKTFLISSHIRQKKVNAEKKPFRRYKIKNTKMCRWREYQSDDFFFLFALNKNLEFTQKVHRL